MIRPPASHGSVRIAWRFRQRSTPRLSASSTGTSRKAATPGGSTISTTWACSPDWSPSGVMTVSAAEPLTECELVAHEPWFGTRKATLITEYALSGTQQTLLVVNIHGINFALGISDLENQFAQARAVIEEHDGPVVFSGDFNTWRSQRAQVLEDMLEALGLTALDFD